MCSVPRRESWWSRGEVPSGDKVGEAPRISPEFFPYMQGEQYKNRYIKKSISVRNCGFSLGRGSLLGMAVAVCLDLALVFRK